MILTTERLTLRKPDARDIQPMVDFYASDRSRFVAGPMTPGQAWRQFAAEVGHWDLLGYGMWTVTLTETGEGLGLVGPWTPNNWPEKEVGWLMWDNSHGKGYATEAARAAVDDAYIRLGWDTVVSYVDPANVGSAKVAQKLGAVVDPNAPQPYPDAPVDVYRHPKVAT